MDEPIFLGVHHQDWSDDDEDWSDDDKSESEYDEDDNDE